MNETLTELFLADNKLMPTDGIQLGNLLKYNHKLQLLDVRNNNLQVDSKQGTSSYILYVEIERVLLMDNQ